MSKVQVSPREDLRQGIRELWTAAKSGTRFDKRKAIQKIKAAVEREERIMLNRIQVEETDELDDLDGLAEQIETAEALVAGEPLAEPVATPEELRARELKAAGKSYSYIAKEIFQITHASAFYINKVKKLLGEVAVAQEPAKRRGGGRRKVEPLAPNDDGGSKPLTLANGHSNGNGHLPTVAAANGHGDMVSLTPGQFSRLWEIVTGGQVGIQIEGGKVTCLVTESSFKKALPLLIDRL